MSTQDDKLMALLERKPFKELSTTDRAFVLEQLTEQEYELQREVLFTSKQLIEEESEFLTPDPRISSNLKGALTERRPTITILDQIAAFITRPVPAYQFAIGMVLLAFLFVWNSGGTPAEVVYKDKIVYQEKHDTVYVDKPIVEVQIVEKELKVVEYRDVDPPENKESLRSYISEKDRMEEAAAASNAFAFTDQQIKRQQEKSYGNTSMSSEELSRFLVVAN